MDAREIVTARLGNQWLAGTAATDPVAVVAWFGAMQAQEYAIARWSVGPRAIGVVDAAVQRAVDEGRILRTHALRPTWHFIAAADLRWIQALTGPRVHAFSAYYRRLHGLDEPTVAELDGRRYWWVTGQSTVEVSGAPVAHALQAYDEYGIGYSESRDMLNLAGLPVSQPGEASSIHLVTVDGQLVAIWRRVAERAGIAAQVRPLRRLSARERRQVAEAFARYASFAGVPVHVELV